MNVRSGTEKDYNAVLAIEGENMKSLVEDIDKKKWSDFITVINIKRSRLIVYEEAGQIIGLYYYAPLALSGQAALLKSIQVRKDRQNGGIGTGLIQDFLKRTKKEQYNSTALYVHKTNRAAVFYRLNGFKTVKTQILKNSIRTTLRHLLRPYMLARQLLSGGRYRPQGLLGRLIRKTTKVRMERRL